MARNKFPEETVNLILKVSQKLFIEKGYENTSVQDIIDKLGGLSKGAIYHHFKSKEEILMTIMGRREKQIVDALVQVRESKTRNGLEKLKDIFNVSLYDLDKEIAFKAAPNLMANPKMLVMQIDNIFNEVVPNYVEPIIEEGIRDGSIETEYPKQLAEVLILLTNIWLNPLIIQEKNSIQEMYRRIQFYKDMLEKLGLDIIDDELVERLYYLVDLFDRKQNLKEN